MSAAVARPDPRRPRRAAASLAAALALLAALAYLPLPGNGFVDWDDQAYVTGNPRIPEGPTAENLRWAFTTTLKGNWHPLTWVSHLVDGGLYGLEPAGHHVSSLLLHAGSTLLLFAALQVLTGARWRSALVAALFAVHPLHVESVAWASERKDTLAGFFWMLTLAAHARYARRPSAARYAPVAAGAALALLSKPVAVTLPFALLLLDFWPLGRWRAVRPGRLLLEKLPLIAMAAAVGVATYHAQRGSGYVPEVALNTFPVRAVNALLAYLGYLGKTLWPAGLSVFYHFHERPPHAAQPLAAGVAIAAATALCVAAWRARPFLATGWFWYLGTLVPMIGLVQVGNQGLADRYTYLPLVGIFVAAAWGLPGVAARGPASRLTAAAAVLLVGVLAAMTFRQCASWRDTVTLFSRAAAVSPGSYKVHAVLGIALTKEGRIEEANTHFTTALRLHPRARELHARLGRNLLSLGRTAEAEAHFRDDLRLDPGNADTHLDLAALLSRRGAFTEAEDLLRTAVRLDPRLGEAWTGLGLLQSRRGAWAEALPSLERALAINPDDEAVRVNAREARRRLGQVPP